MKKIYGDTEDIRLGYCAMKEEVAQKATREWMESSGSVLQRRENERKIRKRGELVLYHKFGGINGPYNLSPHIFLVCGAPNFIKCTTILAKNFIVIL